MYFVIPFKCILNSKVSINTVWNVSGGHGHPFPLSFHMNTHWWVWKTNMICWVISPAFFHVSTGWCSVSVWENNLGMEVTKPILFPASYEGLQNCMLYWSKSAGQIVNWWWFVLWFSAFLRHLRNLKSGHKLGCLKFKRWLVKVK